MPIKPTKITTATTTRNIKKHIINNDLVTLSPNVLQADKHTHPGASPNDSCNEMVGKEDDKKYHHPPI